MHFSMSSPGEPYAFAPYVARRLGRLNTEEVLRSGSMVNNPEFPEKEFYEVLDMCNEENCLVEVVSQRLYAECEGEVRKEKWYGVEYKVEGKEGLKEVRSIVDSPPTQRVLISSLTPPSSAFLTPRRRNLNLSTHRKDLCSHLRTRTFRQA